VLLPDKITTLQARGPPGDLTYHLILPKNAVLPGEPPDPDPEGEFYILVHAEGKLELPGAILEGSFNLFADESTVLMVMGGRLLVGFESLELLELVAGGAFQIDSDGFAGKLQLSLDEDLDSIPFGELFKDLGEGLGFDLGVQFDLVVNTTTLDKDILLPDTFDPFTAFAVSAADQAILENVGENDPPQWIWLSDDLTKLQAQYDPVSAKVEYHLIVPKSPEIPPDPDQPGEFYILVHAVGKLAFPGFLLDGGFDLFVYQQNAVMDIHAVMTMGSFLEMNAIGILQIDDTGIAGKISLEIIDDNSPLSSLPGFGAGLGFDAEFDLIVNTTEQYKEIVFPDRFNNLDAFGLTDDEKTELESTGSVVLKDGLTRLKSVLNDDGETEYHLIVNNTPNKDDPPPVDIPTPNDVGEYYILVYANGDLRLPGATLTGSFYLLAEETQTVMTVSGHLIVGFGDVKLLELIAGGAFYVDDNGLAGKLQLELEQSVPFEDLLGPGFGFNQEAFFDLTINLTKVEQDFTLPESFDALDVFGVDPSDIQNPGDEVLLSDNLTILRLETNPTSLKDEFHLIVPDTPNPGSAAELYILVHAVGELSMPGFTLKGGFDLFVDQQRATMDVHALMSMGFGDLKLMELEAIGVAQIDSTGLAGKIHLQLIDPRAPPSIPGIETLPEVEAPLSSLFPGGSETELGFSAEAKFDLIINTTEQYKEIVLPDRFDNLQAFGITDEQETVLRSVNSANPVESFLLPDGLTRLKSVYIDADTTEYHLIINNTLDKDIPPPEELPTPNDTGEIYMVVHASGQLKFPGFELSGTFDLKATEYRVLMTVQAQLVLGIPLGNDQTLTLIDLSADGVLEMTSLGISGKVKLRLNPDDPDSTDSVPFAEFSDALGLGMSMDANFDLLVNTTEYESYIELHEGFDALDAFDITGAALDEFNNLEALAATNDVTHLGKTYQTPLDDELTKLLATIEQAPEDGPLSVVYTLIVPNTPEGQQPVGKAYILIHADGQLTLPGLELKGSFDLEGYDQYVLMSVNAQVVIGFGDNFKVLELVAGGVFKINADGVAGKLKLRLASELDPTDKYYDADAPVPFEALGLKMDAQFDLIINTAAKGSALVLPDGFDPFTAFDVDASDENALMAVTGDEVVTVLLADGLTSLESRRAPTELDPDRIELTLTIPNTPYGEIEGLGTFYILIHADGSLSLQASTSTGFFLNGVFDMRLDAWGLLVTANAELEARVAGQTILHMGATGALLINNWGIAAKIELTLDAGADLAGVGFSLGGTFILELNTTENRVGRIGDTTVNLAPGPYVRLLIDGHLQLYIGGSNSFLMEGSFVLQYSSIGLEMAADATLKAIFAGKPLLSANAKGALLINDQGLAAKIALDVGAGFSGIGFVFNGSFVLEVNTTNQYVPTIAGQAVNLVAGPYAKVTIVGYLKVLNILTFNGTFILSVDSEGIRASVDAKLRVFNVSFKFTANALINDSGLAFTATLLLASGSHFTPFPNFQIYGTFKLGVNTTSGTVYGIAKNTARVQVLNGGLNLFGLKATGSITISAGSGGFNLYIPSNDPLTLKVGPITASLSGYAYSDGRWRLHRHCRI
jgi:hypothetical protein